MFCPKCSKEIPNGSNICLGCGFSFQVAASMENTIPQINVTPLIVPNWSLSLPNLSDQEINPGDYLGNEDASVEWEQDEKPVNLFLHTEAYCSFKEDNFLYLFGRRGTGKTAIIRMLHYEIRNDQIKNYRYSWIVNSEDTFSNFAESLKKRGLDPDLSTINHLSKKWRWIFDVSAMEAVVLKHYNEAKNDKNLITIIKYLNTQSLIKDDDNKIQFGKNPLDKITTLIEEYTSPIITNYREAAAVNILSKVIKSLYSEDFQVAKQALSSFISKSNRCMILIDSIDKYDISDKTSQIITAALIKATYDVYIESSKTGLHVKVAFPSEIYPYMSSTNKDKIESKNLFIMWSYKELINLLAKRYDNMLAITDEVNYKSYKDLYKYGNPKNYLYQFFPPKIQTRNGLEMDTMAYIIRHTQKKPRQIILLMNIVLNYAIKRNKENFYQISSKSIINGIHARLDILAKGALDAYEQIFPNATRIIQKSLTNVKCYFNYSDFDKFIKESHGIRRKDDFTETGSDIKSIFIGTGAVGILNKKNVLKKLNKELWESLFEYQIKGTIEVNNNNQFVIHPMFYNFFKCQVDQNVIVFPQPQEDEEIEYLSAEGICLV